MSWASLSVSFDLAITFTAYSFRVFFSTHYRSRFLFRGYAIHLRKAALPDLLSQIVEIAEAPHARRLFDRLHPAGSLRFRGGVEGLVVRRWELQREPEVLRVLRVGESTSKPLLVSTSAPSPSPKRTPCSAPPRRAC